MSDPVPQKGAWLAVVVVVLLAFAIGNACRNPLVRSASSRPDPVVAPDAPAPTVALAGRSRPAHPDDLFVYEWRERFDAASADGTLTASLAAWEEQFPVLRSDETTHPPATAKYGTVRGTVSARAPSAFFLTTTERGPAIEVMCGDREDIERRCNTLAIGDEVSVAASVVGRADGLGGAVLSVRTFMERRGAPNSRGATASPRATCGADPSSLMGGAPRAVETWLRANGVDPDSGNMRCGRASMGASCWELTCELPRTGAWYSFKIANGAVTHGTRTR